jgi:predicted nucleic acid-binding protein
MGVSYIWDTNTVIYYFNKHFPAPGEKYIDQILASQKPTISVITEIELLCWKLASENDLLILNTFINDAHVFELDTNVKLKTIDIRRRFKLKLPDAIIAASALVHNQVLISRNLSDFGKISDLKIIDPFSIK